jgi:hypothetical protein
MKKAKKRTKEEVVAAANKSRATQTISGKSDILKETGVRWSEFNRLTYRDPVNHLPLGMMHNWYEGVLQHHFRYRWGFVLYSQEQKTARKKRARAREDDKSTQAQHAKKRVTYEEGAGNACDGDDESMDSWNSEPDVELEAGLDGGLLSKDNIVFFNKRLKDVVLPTGITRLPKVLGEAKHGTLKAAQWHSLFSYVIPLIIIEMYVLDVDSLDKESNRGRILLNIAALCQCTNIVCAKEVSEYEADIFEKFYKRYHETSKQVFTNISLVPNHHYALHIPDQIRTWGPLNQVAEFAGERLIGVVQKIKTNSHIGRFCLLKISMLLEG